MDNEGDTSRPEPPQDIRWDTVSPLTPRQVRTVDDLARLTAPTVHEALECMDMVLELFHNANDNRAIFLGCYRIITKNVRDAIEQQNDFDNPIFFDPHWVARLSGRFATLYFRSLREEDDDRAPPEDGGRNRAWRIAHEEARKGRVSVTQHVLLGINAHINYDLPLALYQNLVTHGDHEQSYQHMYRRKFDHDQVNNILVRSIPQAQHVVSDAYGGLLGVVGSAFLSLDDLLATLGLRYYRERVWWDAVSFLATRDDDERMAPSLPGDEEFTLVQDKLDWESAKLAKSIRDSFGPLGRIAALARRGTFSPFEPG